MPIQTIDRIPPTPETALKLVPSPWAVLAPELQSAALQIDASYRLIAGRSMAKAQQLGRRIPGRSADDPERERRVSALEARYVAWCGAMGGRRLHVRPILQVVSEGLAPHDVDRLWRQPTGWAAERLIEALELWRTVRVTLPQEAADAAPEAVANRA